MPLKIQNIPGRFLTPHYSGRLWKSFESCISKYLDPEIFETICHEIGMDPHYLLQDTSWVSEEFNVEFIRILRGYHSDPLLFWKMGLYTASPDILNPIEYTLYSMISIPAVFYLILPSLAPRYNLRHKFSIEGWRPGFFRYRFMPKDGVPAHFEVCMNFKGMIEASSQFYQADLNLTVTHPRCLHAGDSVCEMEARYSAWKLWKSRLLVLSLSGLGIVLIAFILSELVEGDANVKAAWFKSTVFGSTMFLVGIWLSTKFLIVQRHIYQYHAQFNIRTHELLQEKLKAEKRFQEILLVKELLEKLTESIRAFDVIQLGLEQLELRFGYDNSAMILEDLYSPDVMAESAVGKWKTELEKRRVGQISKFLMFSKIKLVDLKNEPVESALAILTNIFKSFGITKLIIAPLPLGETRQAWLIVGMQTKSETGEDDLFRIENIASAISVAFMNAKTFEAERISKYALRDLLISQHEKDLSDLAIQVAHDIQSPVAALGAIKGVLKNGEGEEIKILDAALNRIEGISSKLLKQFRSRGTRSESKLVEECPLAGMVETILSEKARLFEKGRNIHFEMALSDSSKDFLIQVDRDDF